MQTDVSRHPQGLFLALHTFLRVDIKCYRQQRPSIVHLNPVTEKDTEVQSKMGAHAGLRLPCWVFFLFPHFLLRRGPTRAAPPVLTGSQLGTHETNGCVIYYWQSRTFKG